MEDCCEDGGFNGAVETLHSVVGGRWRGWDDIANGRVASIMDAVMGLKSTQSVDLDGIIRPLYNTREMEIRDQTCPGGLLYTVLIIILYL